MKTRRITVRGGVDSPHALALECGHVIRWSDYDASRVDGGWHAAGAAVVFHEYRYPCAECARAADLRLLAGDDAIGRGLRALVERHERQLDLVTARFDSAAGPEAS